MTKATSSIKNDEIRKVSDFRNFLCIKIRKSFLERKRKKFLSVPSIVILNAKVCSICRWSFKKKIHNFFIELTVVYESFISKQKFFPCFPSK